MLHYVYEQIAGSYDKSASPTSNILPLSDNRQDGNGTSEQPKGSTTCTSRCKIIMAALYRSWIFSIMSAALGSLLLTVFSSLVVWTFIVLIRGLSTQMDPGPELKAVFSVLFFHVIVCLSVCLCVCLSVCLYFADSNDNDGDVDNRNQHHIGRMWSNLRHRLDTISGKESGTFWTVFVLVGLLSLVGICFAVVLYSYKWNDWGDWQACSVYCGNGTGVQHRLRTCSYLMNDWECDKVDRETRTCSASAPCPSDPVCFQNYTTFNESYRRESVGVPPYNCDRDKVDGNAWYRFQLSTGENGVLDHCPRIGRCGTSYPLWMNGTHPEEFGTIKQVTMGASIKGYKGSDDCFWYSGSALVTKCWVDGDIFYLYQLWDPPSCSLSYCTRAYSGGHKSKSGFANTVFNTVFCQIVFGFGLYLRL